MSSKKGKQGRSDRQDGDVRRRKDSTLAALLKDKPRRGRPRRPVSRQNVYVALSDEQKDAMKQMAKRLPEQLGRADVPDLSITLLTARLEEMRRAVADRNREIPEGVTDLVSLYLLWDLALPAPTSDLKWTSIRVSPQQGIELGRAHGTLNALFGATRSEVFGLGLALLGYLLENHPPGSDKLTLTELQSWIIDIYL